jgi:hypothetical protein
MAEPIRLNPDLEAEVLGLLREGSNLLALKRITETTGCSFGEACGWLDRHDREDTPCPYCGKPLRTSRARQCFECGTDWHHGNPIA